MVPGLIRRLVLALGLALALPGAAVAQPAPAAAPAKVDQTYYDLFDAVMAGFDANQMAERMSDGIIDGLTRNDPVFADLIAQRPPMRARLKAAMLPFMLTWAERSKGIRREQIAQALALRMTPGEARDIANFYSSPLGQRFLRALSANFAFDATIDSALQSGSSEVDKAARSKDQARTVGIAVEQLLSTMTPAESRQMAAFNRSPGARKLSAVSAAVQSVPEPGFDEMTTAAERDAFGKAIRDVMIDEMTKQ